MDLREPPIVSDIPRIVFILSVAQAPVHGVTSEILLKSVFTSYTLSLLMLITIMYKEMGVMRTRRPLDHSTYNSLSHILAPRPRQSFGFMSKNRLYEAKPRPNQARVGRVMLS